MSTWIILLLSLNVLSVLLFALLWKKTEDRPKVKDLAEEHSKIPVFKQSLPKISAELDRARRYHHRLSLVVFQLAAKAEASHPIRKPPTKDSQDRDLQSLRFLLLGSVLREELRAYDLLTYDPSHDQYVVLLVESNRRQASQFVERITEAVTERAELTLLTGIAEFPYAGLIIEDLLARATENCQMRERKPARLLHQMVG